MTYDELSRFSILKGIYDKMSTEEKMAFLLFHLKGKGDDALQALQQQQKLLYEIHDKVEKDNWVRDFGANVAGNAAYAGIAWLLGKVLQVIK